MSSATSASRSKPNEVTGRAWSVVVKGVASRVEEPVELALANRAPLWTWAPGTKEVFITIVPTEVTGRFFDRT